MNAVARATTLTALRNAGAAVDLEDALRASPTESRRGMPVGLDFRIHDDLAAVESEWRDFERVADCTPFQTYDWLSAWQRHIGRREGVRPAVVVGRYEDGGIAFILPLAVERRVVATRLCWLGDELCDYNAPLLARDFSLRVGLDRFLTAWEDLLRQLQRDPSLSHDWVELEKMPDRIGGQRNPFSYLEVATNPSGAHLTLLGDDWQAFYTAKRSSATRRRDRAKRRHMSEFGDIRFVTAVDQADARRTLEQLMEQKSRSLLRKGIPDMFSGPGRREFFLELACNPAMQHLVHFGRLEVGTICAAANIGVVFGDCYYHVLASYNEEVELSRYGPGAMHLRELLAYAIGRGLKRFDFTIGDEPYKLEWSDTRLKLWDHTAAATWRGVPARLASNAKRVVKRYIKQTPLAWRLVCRVRVAVGALSTMMRGRSSPSARADLRRS